MASNYVGPHNFRELWLSITENHIKYLCEDKSPVKIKYRDILQSKFSVHVDPKSIKNTELKFTFTCAAYIKELLSVVAHRRKFNYSKTEEILRRSVQCDEFNALKAASAWLAISTYANNLFLQPWRKEYYEIRVSSFKPYRVTILCNHANVTETLCSYIRDSTNTISRIV